MKIRNVLIAVLTVVIVTFFSSHSYASQKAVVQEMLPIIDMHVHAFQEGFGQKDYYGNPSSANAEMLFKETYERFRKYNIVKAVVSGPFEAVETWKSKDKDNRIIRGILINAPDEGGMNVKRFKGLVKTGKIEVFGEIGALYAGATLSDPGWQPYLRICEQYDVPVCVHTGNGAPGAVYTWAPKMRLRLGDPYLIEDVLVRYPKLRIYICHAGTEWYDHSLALMNNYPQLYTDIAANLWCDPFSKLYARKFLANAKEVGFLDRVMFGTDGVFWPHAIEASIEYLNSLDFLTEKDKRDILYNNAARFLRLEEE